MKNILFHRKSIKLRFVSIFLCMLAFTPETLPIAHAQVAAATVPGFHVNGRSLFDANGNNFIMRGINVPHNWYPEQTSQFQNTKAKGANSVRVVLSSGQNWPKNSASDVANVINLCKTNKLVCVLEVHDTTGYGEVAGATTLTQAVTYWKEIQSVLTGQEAYVIINIGNEPYGNNNASGWINATKNAIAEMRTAGFQHTLMVDAPNWGQDWEFIMRDNAASVFNSDPLKNIVFSIHMYGVFEAAAAVQSYVSSFVNTGLPLVIGEFGHQHSDGNPDEDAIMSVAQSNGIGYLGWMWSGGGYLDMVTDFDPQQETSWGNRIIHGVNGIAETSQEASIYSNTSSLTISGNAGTNGATLSYTDGIVKTVVANGIGNYSITVPYGWSGTITPSHTCFTFNPASISYSNVTSNQTVQNYAPTLKPASGCAEIDVLIGGNNKGHYGVPSGQSIFDRYKLNGGPVHVMSTNGLPIFTSERAIFGSSFNSIVGYPGDQLTTDYWFTSYDDVGMITFLVISNPHPTDTALVDVYIGGVKRNATPYSIGPGQRIFPRYGINAGPVHVVSTNGVDIFTSERTRFGNSFNEVMGYPGDQLTTEYWFTSYDDAGMITYLVIGNPHPADTAEVDVYIGGVKKNAIPYQIAPGQRLFPRYGINGGPVRVVSTNGVDIFTSERTKFGNTFNEVMGYPGDQVSTEFWFTSYDDVGMITFLVVGNPHPTDTAEVDVYIGGVKRNTTPYQIAPGQRMFQRYGINSGPVHVVSTNGVDVFASERSKYLSSFNEILGIADSQLATDYWFTSYDDVGMTTFLVIGAP